MNLFANSVAFARIFFPAEAKLAMKIAQAETTSEFAGLAASRRSGNLREVDLNETPTVQNKRLRSRVDALTKTGNINLPFFALLGTCVDTIFTFKNVYLSTLCTM